MRAIVPKKDLIKFHHRFRPDNYMIVMLEILYEMFTQTVQITSMMMRGLYFNLNNNAFYILIKMLMPVLYI